MQFAVRFAYLSVLFVFSVMVFSIDSVAAKTKAEQRYSALITEHARANGVPLDLARAVVKHESRFKADATGAAGEIGLMQIKLSTARGMGYKGTAKGLYDPATNIRWGMKYLGKARELAGGSQCGTLSRYNGGHGTKRMIRGYCNKVEAAMRG
jgi:soluble lytic murein transglycosylase-like protein